MTSPRNSADALRRVLEGTRLDRTALDKRVAEALDPGYWRRLCPSLSMGAAAPRGPERTSLDDEARRELVRQLREEGYARSAPVFPAPLTRRMCRSIAAIKKDGWPPVFALVFDEFWEIRQTPSLVGLLGEALGADYQLIPRIWCYYVHPVKGAKGWGPHADAFGRPGVTVWIPLSDATLDNGCIYVVPKNLMAGRVEARNLFDAGDLPLGTVTELLQYARAVPAVRGSILLWDFDVIHWGSVVTGAAKRLSPRISISAEFVPAASGWTTVLPPSAVPVTLEDRLRVIVSNIRMFADNDPWTFKFLDLGEHLASALEMPPARS